MVKTYLSLFALIFLLSISVYAQQERRIAASYFNSPRGVLQPSDSTVYVYNDRQRGKLDSSWSGGTPTFDTAYSWQYIAATSSFGNQQRQLQTYTLADEPLYNILQNFNTISGEFFDNQHTIDSYSTGNLPLESVIQNYDTISHTSANYQRTSKKYDGANRQIGEVAFSWNGSTSSWDTLAAFSALYDSAGHEIAAENQYWSSGTAYYNTFFDYTYTSSGFLDIRGIHNYRNYILSSESRELYSYNADHTVAVEVSQVYDSTSGWHLADSIIFSYDAAQNSTGYLKKYYSSTGFGRAEKYTVEFDALNMVIADTLASLDSAGNVSPIHVHHYYYEPYGSPSAISVVYGGKARIYPVPATDMLHIDVDWSKTCDGTATVYDMIGRVCGVWHLPASSSYHGYLSIGTLPVGEYAIEIKGGDDHISKNFSILK